MELALWIVFAYLLGSIPFGVVAARLFGGRDPRTGGSGNIGATNVLRTVGRKAGVFTLACDALKGYLPAALAAASLGSPAKAAAVGMAAFLGHLFPLYLRFRGGKGVATGAGVFLALSPAALGASLVVFVLVVVRWRMVSLGSVVSAVVLVPATYLFREDAGVVAAAALTAALSIWKHRANIRRIAAGEESRLGKKKE
jgi:glycerol-3-phosphate acyltransferase PlsY